MTTPKQELTDEELIAEVRHRFSKPTAWDLQRDPLDMSMAALTHSLATRLEAALARADEWERRHAIELRSLYHADDRIAALEKQRAELKARLSKVQKAYRHYWEDNGHLDVFWREVAWTLRESVGPEDET